MILDLQSMLSGTVSAAGVKTGQAVTVTAISENVIDRKGGQSGPTLEDQGILGGAEMWLIVQVLVAFTAAGAATMTITLESDTTANLATAPVVHYATSAIPVASLIAGFTAVRVQLPSADYKTFIGLRYTIATGPMTAGNIAAYLTPDPQRNVHYPAGFTIDV